jgi:hypothetical protein
MLKDNISLVYTDGEIQGSTDPFGSDVIFVENNKNLKIHKKNLKQTQD